LAVDVLNRVARSTCKQNLTRRVEIINWALGNMKNLESPYREIKETKLKEIIKKFKKSEFIFEPIPIVMN
jgi:hypothetical protein